MNSGSLDAGRTAQITIAGKSGTTCGDITTTGAGVSGVSPASAALAVSTIEKKAEKIASIST